MPKISVVMPVYNGEKYIKEAIDSILSQTFPDFEFIIINDCSTDNTESIIKSYNDSRIRYIKNEKNLGVAESLNKGLDVAKGEYITRMDADDISLPERFEKQISFMDRHKNIAVSGCAIERFGAIGGKAYNEYSKEKIRIGFLFRSCIFHPTVMMRRSVMEIENYRYDVHFDKVEDYELWTRILPKYDICSIKSVLLKYRVHSGQVTQNYSQMHKKLLLELKKKFLLYIGIDVLTDKEIRAFNDYCLEEIDYNEQAKDLIISLKKIVLANNKARFFSEKNLRKSFAKIVLIAARMQDIYNKKDLIKMSGLATKFDIYKDELKQFIKRLIRRDK